MINTMTLLPHSVSPCPVNGFCNRNHVCADCFGHQSANIHNILRMIKTNRKLLSKISPKKTLAKDAIARKPKQRTPNVAASSQHSKLCTAKGSNVHFLLMSSQNILNSKRFLLQKEKKIARKKKIYCTATSDKLTSNISKQCNRPVHKCMADMH